MRIVALRLTSPVLVLATTVVTHSCVYSRFKERPLHAFLLLVPGLGPVWTYEYDIAVTF